MLVIEIECRILAVFFKGFINNMAFFLGKRECQEFKKDNKCFFISSPDSLIPERILDKIFFLSINMS